MSTRDEVARLFEGIKTDLKDHEAMAILSGEVDSFNKALYEARHNATKAALVLLAEKIDKLG
jgi:hypothetical protein